MSKQLISLGIETCNIFDAGCVQEIKTAKIIKIITKNFDDALIQNIDHIIIHMLHMKVVKNKDQYNENYADTLRKNVDTKNTVLIIHGFILSAEEREEFESIYEKIIYCYYTLPYSFSDITFFDGCELMTLDEKNIIYNICKNDDVLFMKPNSFQICKIERSDTYDNYYNQYSSEIILQSIKNIAHGKSVFWSKEHILYSKLWTKYYFLIHCNNIWLQTTYFIKQLDIAIYSIDMLVIIFRFMVNLFENDIYNKFSNI